ncbi:DUF2854 domain-containing protein [Trichothermofontia sp.]
MFRKISLGSLGLWVGGTLTLIGFIAYFGLDNATLNLVGFFYGFPLLLGGLALKFSELKPVPFTQPTSPDVLALRQKQATAIQNQVREDLDRYRYGQKAHFDKALAYLGLSPSDAARPVVTGMRETAIDNAYALILEFDSPAIPLATWRQKQEKLASFFGAGVRVAVAQPADERIELSLIATPDT